MYTRLCAPPAGDHWDIETPLLLTPISTLAITDITDIRMNTSLAGLTEHDVSL